MSTHLARLPHPWGASCRKAAPLTYLLSACDVGCENRSFQSLAGKTKHQLWLELCDIITKHPAEVQSLPVDGILRGGIRKFTDEVGRLWTSLADYYIRRALFERARDIYEVPIHAQLSPGEAQGWRACPHAQQATVCR